MKPSGTVEERGNTTGACWFDHASIDVDRFPKSILWAEDNRSALLPPAYSQYHYQKHSNATIPPIPAAHVAVMFKAVLAIIGIRLSLTAMSGVEI